MLTCMKIRIITICVLTAVCILTAYYAHAQSQNKVWSTRGQAWLHCSAYEKQSYVQGVLDGLAFADFKIEGVVVLTTVTFDRIIKAVDQFYGDERNYRVPMPFVLKLMSMELSGKSRATLTGELERLRERFHDK